MKLAVALHAHGNTEVLLDTIESIQYWATNDILVAVDGNSRKWIERASLPVEHFVAFRNNTSKVFKNHSSFRNVTLGLMKIVERYPNADWYCSTEYDTLFASEEFKKDLNNMSDEIWCVGCSGRTNWYHLPLLDTIVQSKIRNHKYLIGCCIFYRASFLHFLLENEILERVLHYTNVFNHGYFPGYYEQGGYDFSECLFPTLCSHYGGKICSVSTWDQDNKSWTGNNRYSIRWPDELNIEDDYVKSATIIHPVKTMQDPVRQYHRKRRLGEVRH